VKYIVRDWYKILTQTPSLGVDYFSLMVERDAEVLAKEEERPEAIPVAVPPQSSSGGGL
jgi:hypothetical protein